MSEDIKTDLFDNHYRRSNNVVIEIQGNRYVFPAEAQFRNADAVITFRATDGSIQTLVVPKE